MELLRYYYGSDVYLIFGPIVHSRKIEEPKRENVALHFFKAQDVELYNSHYTPEWYAWP